MNVLLPSELEKYVSSKVESGLFPSANDVILEGLKLLKERDEAERPRLDELRREIQVGIDQADAGQVSTFDESTLEAIKVEGRPTSRNSGGSSPAVETRRRPIG